MIELIDFGKDYGDFIVVKSFSFNIDVGEIFGFIGFNGVGKSIMICFFVMLLWLICGDGIINGFCVLE